MSGVLTLAEANALSLPAFAERFGGVLEDSPRYAQRVGEGRPYRDAEALADAFKASLESGSLAEQLTLICAHPDLAGKAALAGDVTAESASEQHSAGLDRLTPEEYAEFQRVNAAYHAKFEMPYIVCVREHSKASILSGAAERLKHTPEQERRTALSEIAKIARLRVLDLIER